VREGKNLKGRFLELLFKTVAKGKLEKAFAGRVAAIEARTSSRRPPTRALAPWPQRLNTSSGTAPERGGDHGVGASPLR
jgi:hypothetical protein